jgi:hypothetical protein
MPILGVGLHVLLAIFCAVHVVRSGQQLYWLFILFMFPLLGSVVYFVAIYLPNSRLEHGARKAVKAAAKALDPTKELREAHAAYDDTPTAQNQMRLAAALLEADRAEEAAQLYAKALQGPFASDPEIRYGAARACVAAQRADEALAHLDALHRLRPDYRPDGTALLRARALAALSRNSEARQAFEDAVSRFGSFEAHAEYAVWALSSGDQATAARLLPQIDRMVARWNPMSRKLNEPTMRRLRAAQAVAR